MDFATSQAAEYGIRAPQVLFKLPSTHKEPAAAHGLGNATADRVPAQEPYSDRRQIPVEGTKSSGTLKKADLKSQRRSTFAERSRAIVNMVDASHRWKDSILYCTVARR